MIQNYKYQANSYNLKELPKKSDELVEIHLIKTKTEMEIKWIWGNKLTEISLNPHYLEPKQ
jgi:hypothetical protein